MAREEGRGRGRGRGRGDREERDEFTDKLVAINRVAKVVKGGKNFGFAALVVVGDQKGRVGFGKGKAREVPEAIRKASQEAKRNLVRIPLREGRTLHHDAQGRWGAGKVVLRAAPAGTGIIAGGPMRAIFESLGVQDVVAKSIGSSNPYNMVRATVNALQNQTSPRSTRGQARQESLRHSFPSRRRRPKRGPERSGRRERRRIRCLRSYSHGCEKNHHKCARPAARSVARKISVQRWSASASTRSGAFASLRTRPLCAA